MQTSGYEYWPFNSAAVGGVPLQNRQQIQFLETSHQQGFEAFWFGMNDYGARTTQREGCILERGRKFWEIRLTEGDTRRLLAYVNDFAAAGAAVQHWLAGSSETQVLSGLDAYLFIPPGVQESHVVTPGDQVD